MEKNIERYRSRIVIMGLFVFLVHGGKLYNGAIGIDTEDIIRLGEDFYPGWQQSGRQGLVLLKRLLGTVVFNPYFAGLLTVLLLAAAASLFLLLWDWEWENSAPAGILPVWGWLLPGFLWVSHPVLTEQLYFSLQSLEICGGFLLTAAALYFSMRGICEKRAVYIAAGFFLLLLTFSMYQVFVVLYVFGVLSMLVLRFAGALLKQDGGQNAVEFGDAGGEEAVKSGCVRGEEARRKQGGKETEAGKLWRTAFAHGGLFLSAFGVNMVMTHVFFADRSAYLTGQIQWGHMTWKEGLLRILDHGFRVCTGWNSLYYSIGFGLLALAALWLGGRLVWRSARRRPGTGILWLLMLAALCSTPFWMTFLCGGAPVVRSQLVLPAVTGFLAYFVFRLRGTQGEENRWAGGLLVPALFIVVWGQVQTTMRLYYTDECRYEQDAALGRELITQIERLDDVSGTGLAVVGSHSFSPNNACVTGETIGRSFFDYDTQVQPECYWSTRRVVGFLHTLGYDIGHASKENCQKAVEESLIRPSWPQEGSVWRMGDTVVVKLSDCS